MRSLATEYEHGDPRRLHCRELVWLVTNAFVARYDYPAALADFDNPVFILRIIAKMIAVPFNRNPCAPKKRRESFAEIAISEKRCAQAARS